MKSKLLISITLIILTFNSYSWNAAGHMVIAAIAWENMSSSDQEKVLSILQKHPDAQEWSSDYEEVKSAVSKGEYFMMRASTWADDIRNSANPNRKYHRGEWHYLNYKWSSGRKVDFVNPTQLDDRGKGNVVWAINNSMNQITSTKTTEIHKAMHLAWLIHLIGDLHQPLHTSSMFDARDAKLNDRDGDKGGNEIYIQPFNAPNSLHSFLDKRLGTSIKIPTLINRSKSFQSAYPMNAEMLKGSASDWSKESFKLAVEKVYQNGELRYSTDKQAAPRTPDGYIEDMAKMSEKQAALAGYRLANTIKNIGIT